MYSATTNRSFFEPGRVPQDGHRSLTDQSSFNTVLSKFFTDCLAA